MQFLPSGEVEGVRYISRVYIYNEPYMCIYNIMIPYVDRRRNGWPAGDWKFELLVSPGYRKTGGL